MKLKKYLPLIGTAFLAYLAFVDNIAVNIGDDNTYISHEEFFKKNNPSVNEFINEEEKKECASFVDFADYEKFLDESNFGDFLFENDLLLDTTGDGEKELVRSKVQVVGGLCQVNQEIFKDGKHIWNEWFSFSKADLSFYFGKDYLSEEENQKALFYLGLTHAKFTERMSSPEAFPKRLQQMIGNYFRDSNLLERDKFNSEYVKELKSYKGHYVFKRHASHLAIYMWDKAHEQFIEVFTPVSAV